MNVISLVFEFMSVIFIQLLFYIIFNNRGQEIDQFESDSDEDYEVEDDSELSDSEDDAAESDENAWDSEEDDSDSGEIIGDGDWSADTPTDDSDVGNWRDDLGRPPRDFNGSLKL